MSQIVVTFEKDWIDQQRAKGVRVIRQLEKWLGSIEGVALKRSSGTGLTVEVQPAGRERFLKGFAEHLREDFGEENPWAHTTFSGDLAGLDIPQDEKMKRPETGSRRSRWDSRTPIPRSRRPSIGTMPTRATEM